MVDELLVRRRASDETESRRKVLMRRMAEVVAKQGMVGYHV